MQRSIDVERTLSSGCELSRSAARKSGREARAGKRSVPEAEPHLRPCVATSTKRRARRKRELNAGAELDEGDPPSPRCSIANFPKSGRSSVPMKAPAGA